MAKTNNSDISKQLTKLRRNKRILWLAILFFVLVALWILLSIFATTKTSSITAEQRELAKSFVPRLESKVFDEIASKRFFSEVDLNGFSIYVFDKNDFEGKQDLIDIIGQPDSINIIENEQETQVATESTSVEVNPEASESSNVL